MTNPAVQPPNQPPPLRYDNFVRGFTDYFVDPPQGFARKLDNLLLTPQGKPFQRPGSLIWNLHTPQLNNAERIGAMTYMVQQAASYRWVYLMGQNRLYASSFDLAVDTYPKAWAEVTDGTGKDKVFKSAAGTAVFSYSKFGEHLLIGAQGNVGNTSISAQPLTPVKVYVDFTNNIPIAITAGLPAGVEPGGVNYAVDGNSSGGANHYIWYFVYVQTYKSWSGVTYTMRGTPLAVTDLLGLTNPIGVGQGIQFTAIPQANTGTYPAAPGPGAQWLFSTGVGNAYPVADGTFGVQFEIYRTTAGGTVPFFVGSTGSTTFKDNITDAILVTRRPLYTNDGTKANDLPPSARYVLALGACGYYANCVTTDSSATICPQRLYQSSPGIIDAVPGSFFLDFEEPINALSYYDTTPLVWLETKHYAVDGIIDQQGNGSMVKRIISGSTGCISNAGVVVVGRNIYFPGNDGFYVCNGYTSQKISAHLNRSYALWSQALLQKSRISGTYNPGDNRIYWSMASSASATDNDIWVVLDLNLPMDNGGVFTTASGGPQNTNWYSTATMAFEDGTLYRGDRRGFAFKHDTIILTDPVYDAGTSTAWAVSGVYFDIQTPVVSHGDMKATKWYSKIYATLYHYPQVSQNTSLHLQFNTEKEQRNVWSPCAMYFKTGLDPVYPRDITAKRMVPSGQHRSRLRSWEIVKAWANLYKSDDYTTVTITGTNTIQMIPTTPWPTGIEKIAKISLSVDGYVAEYPIVTRSGDTITVTGGPANGAGIKWVVRNYPPAEFFWFESFEVPYVFFGGHSNALGWTATEDNKNA